MFFFLQIDVQSLCEWRPELKRSHQTYQDKLDVNAMPIPFELDQSAERRNSSSAWPGYTWLCLAEAKMLASAQKNFSAERFCDKKAQEEILKLSVKDTTP